MDITVFLASLWGPVLLAVAVGVMLNRAYYVKIYRDLDKDVLAVLVFGMVGMTAGIAHIQFHNAWETLPQVVVSFLGWGLVAKSVLFLAAPSFVDKTGDVWAKYKLIPVAGILTLIVGGYLTWFAYFA